MPSYILGSVYERFLGKEIITDKHLPRIEEKPAVRKAGGVYYTPEYIVQYIVENTIERPRIKYRKTTADSKNIEITKILDPACGSGSFLLVAYEYMLEFYKAKKQTGTLTLAERKQILLDHIFGVDLDQQAVEVTKLSLYLKVLEGVTKDEVAEYTKNGANRVLPSLHNNIKCGNSLIDDKKITAKAFGWKEEFPMAMLGGGFDVVVGNPPYVQLQKDKENSKNYAHYKTYTATGDIYCIFYEQAINLIKTNGTLGMITSNK
jgi:type I restriction-modification system DNA methylase subunit